MSFSHASYSFPLSRGFSVDVPGYGASATATSSKPPHAPTSGGVRHECFERGFSSIYHLPTLMMFRRKSRSQSAPEEGIKKARDAAPSSPQRARSMLKLPRSTSLPASLHGYRIKGIMKFCTVDDSLHSKYGESKDGSEGSRGGERGRIQFKDLLIREYARTVGDNPSCSSGPPIS